MSFLGKQIRHQAQSRGKGKAACMAHGESVLHVSCRHTASSLVATIVLEWDKNQATPGAYIGRYGHVACSALGMPRVPYLVCARPKVTAHPAQRRLYDMARTMQAPAAG